MKRNKIYQPDNCVVIHAMPTCGKTTWVSAIRKDQSLRVIDTDDIIATVCPDWFNRKLWQSTYKESPTVTALGEAIDDAILELVFDICLTVRNLSDVTRHVYNFELPDDEWRNGATSMVFVVTNKLELFLDAGWDVLVSVGRTPEDMVAKSASRGGTPFDLETTTAWYESWVDKSSSVPAIVLDADAYLSDVLKDMPMPIWGADE